jgi:hypothetical protein
MNLELSKMTLAEKLKEIPRSPGVYLHKDAAGKVIYIGKAKNLRNRVRSYFQAGRRGDFSYGIKTDELVNQIADVEVIVTDNEVEAFILEASPALFQLQAKRRQVLSAPEAHHQRAISKMRDHAPDSKRRRTLLWTVSARVDGAPDDRSDQSDVSTAHLRYRNRR